MNMVIGNGVLVYVITFMIKYYFIINMINIGIHVDMYF